MAAKYPATRVDFFWSDSTSIDLFPASHPRSDFIDFRLLVFTTRSQRLASAPTIRIRCGLAGWRRVSSIHSTRAPLAVEGRRGAERCLSGPEPAERGALRVLCVTSPIRQPLFRPDPGQPVG